MVEKSVVLCAIADEHETGFLYVKKKWRLKTFFSDYENVLMEAISTCETARTRNLYFNTRQTDHGNLELVLFYQNTSYRIRPIEMQVAADLLPIVFTNFLPSLEFQVREKQYKRTLKSYVTTKLYDELYNKHQAHLFNNNINALSLPNCFKSTLRNYQTLSVLWMLNREREKQEVSDGLTHLFALDGKTHVLKNNYCLHFCEYAEKLPSAILPPGGILADEMGLGKTVELLALIVMNPRSHINNTYWDKLFAEQQTLPEKRPRLENKVLCICQRKREPLVQCNRCGLFQHMHCVQRQKKSFDESNYMCPNCWTELTSFELVESGCTFIVSPNAIKMQWLNEISTHINPGLKVLLYEGMNSGSWLSPIELASYDIVLCDYSILRSEIYHTADFKSDRTLRNESRSMRPISPLLMIKWWRVCLDEAQMVESNTSNVAEMVRKLPAVNRWAVTGTPIQRTIDDLRPLLHFIGYPSEYLPNDVWVTIRTAFLLNHNPDVLVNLLRLCMWRTCKSKVENELGIPENTEIIHRLELSNVESLYYREEHIKCNNQLQVAFEKHMHYDNVKSSSLSSISPQSLKKILQPFLRIRQICSIPVVAHNNQSVPTYLNPNELWLHLKSSNESECKSELRSWASSYNGIGSIYFIRKQYKMAIQYYELVLKLAKDYNAENISVDSTIQIHAIHNKIEAFKLLSREEEHLDFDQTNYQIQLKQLEWKYLKENSRLLQSTCSLSETKLEELERLESAHKHSIVDFFSNIVTENPEIQNTLWAKVRDEMYRQNISSSSLESVSSAAGMIYVIDVWNTSVVELRNKLKTQFKQLKNTLNDALGAVERSESLPQHVLNFIRNVSDCHLSYILKDEINAKTKRKPGNHCKLCTMRKLMNRFECLLFAKELDESTNLTEGLEKSSVEIILAKAIFTFFRSKSEFAEWQLECLNKLEILDCLQSLCKFQIKYWIEAEYVIKAFDELDMCKMRITLTEDPSEVSRFLVMECQLSELLATQMNNAKDAQLSFIRLSGRLKYLKHLKDDSNDKSCPICTSSQEIRFVGMACGHFICFNCMDQMKKAKLTLKKCPICRQESETLYYWMKNVIKQSALGNYSSKILYIVNLVLNLKEEGSYDNPTKILIFSQWESILKYISCALQENNISYRSKSTNRDIEEFKNPELKITCLLMPLSRGSKGLNLIEATHVFLVEPILNPGEELQAIGRIHRFGQTKPTKVHRFIVNETIEANILSLITSADDQQTLSTHWDLENLTLESLKDLFVLKDKYEDL